MRRLRPKVTRRAGARERETSDDALEWQRASALATWEVIRGGDDRDVGFDALEAEFERALAVAPPVQ